MAGLQKNKDLDLRRHGKNLYTKALKDGGNGESDGSENPSTPQFNLKEIIASLKERGWVESQVVPIEQVEQLIAELSTLSSLEVYGNEETAVGILMFFDPSTYPPQDETPEEFAKLKCALVYLSQDDIDILDESVYWKIEYSFHPGAMGFSKLNGNIITSDLLVSSKCPESSYPQLQQVEVQDLAAVKSGFNSVSLSSFASYLESIGYDIQILGSEATQSYIAKFTNSNNIKSYYTPVAIIPVIPQ